MTRRYAPRTHERGHNLGSPSGGSHLSGLYELQRIVANLSPAERALWRKLFNEPAPAAARNAKGGAAA